MAVEPLSEQLIQAGQSLASELDRIGLHPQGVLWLHAHHLNDWRFTVISDLVDELGRRRTYSLIEEALEKIGQREGLTVMDIHLAAPDEILARVIGGVIEIDAGVAKLVDCKVNGMPVDAVVFRLTGARPKSEIKRAAAQFQRAVSKGEFAPA